jgi:hypothetical protein
MHPCLSSLIISALIGSTSISAQTVPPFNLPSWLIVSVDTAHPPEASRPTAYRLDALLPANRIVAFYGNPLSTRMGILGEIEPEAMMSKLDSVAETWRRAEPTRPVRPALHLIVTVAQPEPGRDGMFRLRHGSRLINRVAGWAESRGWLLFLDIQPGLAPIGPEIDRLEHWLKRPYVHLGIDPEFAMPPGQIPGQKIGTLDAADVNVAVDRLAQIATRGMVPPKVLVVHRFTEDMLTNQGLIKSDPRVQVVIDADGFGSPANKQKVFEHVVTRRPVQFAGLKLFYKNDSPMMDPEKVVAMQPTPLYIQYQ